MTLKAGAMRLSIAATVAMLIASPAAALSCMAPSFDRSFDRARDAQETYGILVGSIDVNEAKVKQASKDGTTPYSVVGVFTGAVVDGEGLSETFERDIAVEVKCYGPWCGNAQDIEDVIFFAEVGPEGGLTAEDNPCGGTFFDADKESINLAMERLRGLK